MGAPYPGGWYVYPEWFCQLIVAFDKVFESEEIELRVKLASMGMGGLR